MTCFWTSIIAALGDDINNVLNCQIRPSVEKFIGLLKGGIIETSDVLWNGNELSPKEYVENSQRIREIDTKTINLGYDCSTCEPVLLLICQLFKINIQHNFNGHIVNYTNELNSSNRCLKFRSNLGHFLRIN